MRLLTRRAIPALLGCLLFADAPLAQTTPPAAKPPVNADAKKLALSGYDPVAYFTLAKPTPGRADITVAHDGAIYRFTKAEHKAAFEAEPIKYLPQYGGFCAYAVANGYTAAVDPNAWKVVEGKLYLNYNASVAKSWASGQAAYIKTGDRNWIDWQKLKRS